jgi:CubicO group peptidase (beta-lactamase class C family)
VASFAIVAASQIVGAQSPSSTDSAAIARIDSLFARVNADTSPGCAVGVGRDGLPSILRGYGSASLEYAARISAATRFDAASIAKQFTAASLVLLAEHGKLSLDDDIRRFVPELPRYDSPITLRQLMHHTSGLRDQWDLLWLAGGRDDDPTEDEDVLSLIFRQRALNFRPGTQFLYSNSGYTLLALVVKRVSGLSLKEFASQNLFVPVGMTQTYFLDDRFQLQMGVASGYRRARGSGWNPSPYLYDTYGPGGLFTTVEDLLRWYESVGAGGLAGGALRREALRRDTLPGGDTLSYSMGLELGKYRGRSYIGHGGNDLGANAFALRLLDEHLTVAVLCNARETDAFTLARRALDVFLPPPVASASAPPSATAPAALVATPAEQLARYAGVYFNPLMLTTRKVELRDGRLIWARGGDGTPLDAVTPDRYRFPPGQPAELFFPAARRGESQVMHLISGSSVTVYHRAEPFVAPAGGVAAYAGEFHNEELDVTWRIVARDGSIEVGTLSSWSFKPQPIFRDAFALPEAVVLRFTRDKGGRIDGLLAEMPRTRGVRFAKVRPHQ